MAKNDSAFQEWVGQVVQGGPTPQSLTDHPSPPGDGRRLTATALLTPATIFVAISLFAPLAILFRYSLNEFVPTKKMMVEALTIANYVSSSPTLLHVDPADDGRSPCW